MHTLVALALGIGGMSMMTGDAAVVPFAVTMVYAIASPVLIALRRWWFVNAILSTVGMIVLSFIMPVLGAMAGGHRPMNSAALTHTLGLPVLIFPCALVLSGIMRLLIVRRQYIAKKTGAARD